MSQIQQPPYSCVPWKGRNFNQSPKAIKWSAVPLPCSTFFLVFMGGGRAAAPIGDEVVRPSFPLLWPKAWLAGWLAGPQIWLAGPQAWLAGPQAWLAGPQAWLDGPEGGNGWMDG